ncbi:hypothetical protein J437_LFUL006217 [Ladona fulva]|uniref:Anoctamin n=1 Tax=Ladona fulva TaxID=123851 RepID=A0A8K0K8F3_LADFU|nr:hypothetical protein J437_LFUL006217 [Ladona fulva]
MSIEEEVQMMDYPRANGETGGTGDRGFTVADNDDHPCLEPNPRFQYNPSLFFNDGRRSVDFVLVWTVQSSVDESKTVSEMTVNAEKRRVFERNLALEGLELEPELEESTTLGLCFMKIHAPKDVLRRYSEILKLRLPMKEVPNSDIKMDRRNPFYNATMYLTEKIPGLDGVRRRTNSIISDIDSITSNFKKHFTVNTEVFPPKTQRFTAIYSRDKEYLFDTDAEDFFSPAIHSRIVQFILDRKRFTENALDDPYAFGITRLISEGVYTAAYPLHDGDFRYPTSMRNTLYEEWASLKNTFQYQPLDYIKEYFGVKIGLYFAWLGFYTHMLVPASIVGLACFIYSCATLYDHPPR